MQDADYDAKEQLKVAAREVFARLSVEELQALTAMAIETLIYHETGNILEGMLEKIDDGTWDNFHETVLCDFRAF